MKFPRWKEIPQEGFILAAILAVFLFCDVLYFPWHLRLIAQRDVVRQLEEARERNRKDEAARALALHQEKKPTQAAQKRELLERQQHKSKQDIIDAQRRMETQLRNDVLQSQQEQQQAIAAGLKAANDRAALQKRDEENQRIHDHGRDEMRSMGRPIEEVQTPAEPPTPDPAAPAPEASELMTPEQAPDPETKDGN